MKITGIIAEYNPFHNGHHYQYEQIRKKSESSYLVVVMSGSFVQRGEPAVYDKYIRTRAALNAGADLILELPAAFATSSAEDFAAAAVALLDKLGSIDELSFGSECGNIEQLEELAAVLVKEPDDYREALRSHISAGISFPKARNLALLSWLNKHDHNTSKQISKENWDKLLASPNNILGIEYLKALQRRNSNIKPVTITRSGQGYHETGLEHGFASASGIRAHLSTQKSHEFTETLARQVPSSAGTLYKNAVPIFPEDCSLLLNERLLYLYHNQIPLNNYADISDELASRLQKLTLDFASYPERIEQLKTRQYTYTRISRGLIHILLDIQKEHINKYRAADYTSYARILGFRKESAPLLSKLKKSSSVPLITKTADARHTLTGLPLHMFLQDIYCTHIYQAISHQKSGVLPRNEYTQSVIII